MKRKLFWNLFTIMMVAAVCVGLASCGDDDDDDEGGSGSYNVENLEQGNLVGSWKCVSITYVEDGEKGNRSWNDTEKAVLVFNEDGSCNVSSSLFDGLSWSSSKDFKVTWNVSGNTLTLIAQDGNHYDPMPLTIKKLTATELVTEWNDGDDYMETHTFNRITE
ncbi:MAG: lipocalin family protein [Prevotella sp.]